MTDFNQLLREKELINLRESAHYSWRDELNEGSDHPYVDVMPNEKTGDPKKDKKDKKKVEEGWKPLPQDKMMRQSHRAYRKEEEAVKRGDQESATTQMKRRFAMEAPSSRKAALDNKKAKKKAEKVEEGWKPTPVEKMERQSAKAYQKEQDAVRKGDEAEVNKQMKRRIAMKSPLTRRTELINKDKGRLKEQLSLNPNTAFRLDEDAVTSGAFKAVTDSLPDGVLIDPKKKKKEIPWHQKHLRKDPTPNRYDKKND